MVYGMCIRAEASSNAKGYVRVCVLYRLFPNHEPRNPVIIDILRDALNVVHALRTQTHNQLPDLSDLLRYCGV